MMNEYFINIGKDLASKLPDSHFDYNINGVCNLQLSVSINLQMKFSLKF